MGRVMDELMWLRLFGGGVGSGVDVAIVVAFVAFAVLYFLVPVVGYQQERPAGLLASLYFLTADVGVMVIQTMVQWMQVLSGPGAGNWMQGETGTHVMFTFAFLKVALFLVAMITLTSGLRSLRLERSRPDNDSPYGIGR